MPAAITGAATPGLVARNGMDAATVRSGAACDRTRASEVDAAATSSAVITGWRFMGVGVEIASGSAAMWEVWDDCAN